METSLFFLLLNITLFLLYLYLSKTSCRSLQIPFLYLLLPIFSSLIFIYIYIYIYICIYICVCVCVCVSFSVVSYSLQPHVLKPTRLFCPWNSPGRSTEVGSHSLLQGIFLTQGPNPDILNCRQILYHLNHQGNSLPAYFGLILFISNNKNAGSQDWSNIPVASPEVTQVLCIFLFYHP